VSIAGVTEPVGTRAETRDKDSSGGGAGGRPPATARILLYAAMVVVIIIYLYPLVFLVSTALKSNTEFTTNPTGIVTHLTPGNFSEAWRRGNFGAYVLIMASGVGVGPLLIVGYIKSVPKDLAEAAALDGISYLRYVFGFLPALLKPVLSTIFILQAIGVWNELILATILLPDQTKSPVTLGLFAFKGTYTSEWSLLAAATLIVAAPLLVVYVFLQRFLVASVVGGAVKG
jgi:ABC-type glycerol-3-phosphate transport system permease component